MKHLVLIGGGHSHVAVLKQFGMHPLPGVRLTLISRDTHTPYSGMLPGLIAGHYDFDEAHIPLGPLARFAGAELYHDEAIGLDLQHRTVHCRQYQDVPYDVLSINIGSTPGFAQVPGAEAFAIPVKPISTFLQHWQQLVSRVRTTRDVRRIGVVGAGAGGVEMTLAMQVRLQQVLRQAGRTDQMEYHLFSAAPTILPTHNQRVQAVFQRVCAARGVRLHVGRRVAKVSAHGLRCTDGTTYPCDATLWVTQAIAPGWLAEAGLAVDEHGFIRVDAALQAVSHPDVFAAGDVAAVVPHPRAKAGVIAVRQGRPLARNLRRALLGRPPRPFVPQRRWLSLISTGDQYAVASYGVWSLEGRWVWRWKDWIDRRFMRRYTLLPVPESR